LVLSNKITPLTTNHRLTNDWHSRSCFPRM